MLLPEAHCWLPLRFICSFGLTLTHFVHGNSWLFKLNPKLAWDDLSEDTKLRLKNLPEETVRGDSCIL